MSATDILNITLMQGFAGLSLFSVLLMMGLGLAVIFGQMGVINMAHGEFMTIGAYTVYMFSWFAQNMWHAFTPVYFFFAIGAFSATLFMRWRMYGILVAGAAVALVVVGAIALITYTQNWPAVGDWFVTNGPIGVTAWLLVPTVLAAVAGYAVLGRATPRS